MKNLYNFLFIKGIHVIDFVSSNVSVKHMKPDSQILK